MTETPNLSTILEDNLAADLLNILNKAAISPEQLQAIMLELVPFIVMRDHKILKVGIESSYLKYRQSCLTKFITPLPYAKWQERNLA